MRFWLASTDAAFVAEHCTLGLFEGVLTNPATLAAAGRPAAEVIPALCRACPGPVFYQLRDGAVDTMKREADRWLALGHANLGIKVPLDRNGCAVLHWLRGQNVRHRLATCVPTTAQLVLATALEVPWVTPTGSALEKLGGPDKIELLSEMRLLLDRQGSATRLIPSLASPAEMQRLALAGLRHGFLWDKDVARFLDSELVQKGVRDFDKAWNNLAATGGAY